MSIPEMYEGKHCQSCFTLENTAIPHVNLYILQNQRVSSDHEAETSTSPPLFRHCDITTHLFIEEITVMDDPGFQNEC